MMANHPLKKMSDIVSDKLSKAENKAYQKICDYLARHSEITNKDIQQLLGKSPQTVRRYLSKFVNLNLLQAQGENKARVYFL